MPTKIKNDEEVQTIDFRYDEGFRGRIESDVVSTITTKASGYSGMPMLMQRESGCEMSKLRIRKLTPRECIRLMGFTDEDYQALKDIGLSDSAIYHVAGDSIITTCLASIIYPFTNNDRKGHKTIVDDYVANNIIEERN